MRTLTLAMFLALLFQSPLRAQTALSLTSDFHGDLQIMTATDTSWVDARIVEVGQCLRYARTAELKENPDLFRAYKFDQVTAARLRQPHLETPTWQAVPDSALTALRGCIVEPPPT